MTLWRTFVRLIGISEERSTVLSDSSQKPKPELYLSREDLSDLFYEQNWCWDVGSEVRPPDPDEIETMFDVLSGMLDQANNPQAVASLGRFVLYTDPELPNDWGIYLELGYIPKNRGVNG